MSASRQQYYRIDREAIKSETLSDALELADKILNWDKTKEIMLEFDKKCDILESSIDMLIKSPIEIKSAKYPKISDYQNLYLNTKLVEICECVKRGSEDYNRLIFFVAVCVLHETCHWRYCINVQHDKPENVEEEELREPVLENELNSEVGRFWDYKMIGGILDMRYHYDKNTKQWKILHLAIRTSKKSSIIKIVSPLAKNLSKTLLRFGPDGKVRSQNGELHQESNVHLEQTPISTKESPKKSTAPKENSPSRDDDLLVVLKVDVSIEPNDDGTDGEVSITVTNSTQKKVPIPENFHRSMFEFGLENETGYLDFEYSVVTDKSALCLIDECKPLLDLKPNDAITYKFNLLSIFKNVLPGVVHNLSVNIYAIYWPGDEDYTEYTYVSNTDQKNFILNSKPELNASEEVITCPIPDDLSEILLLKPPRISKRYNKNNDPTTAMTPQTTTNQS